MFKTFRGFGKHILGAVVILAATHFGVAHAGDGDKPQRWAGTWATAAQLPGIFDAPATAPNDQTLRQIVRVSQGGKFIRVRLSNALGTAPLTIGAASVGRSTGAASVEAGSVRTLTFGGETSVTIAAGARVLSDPVSLSVNHLSDLAVSIYVPDGGANPASPVTGHIAGLQTNYIASGNQVDAIDPLTDSTTLRYTYLTGVDVAVAGRIPVIAFLGDSITDGTESTPDANTRYPNLVAERLFKGQLNSNSLRAGVLNLGIAGNQVTASLIGPSAQARLDRDVLTQTGVTHVVILIGINDIGLPTFLNILGIPTPLVEPADIIAGHKQLIARAKARGLKVIGATLTPSGNFVLPDYNTPTGEAKRQAVNDWIRNSGAYDAVIDFDAVLADPDNPAVMRADLSADGLHPNDAGYQAMADAIPLNLFRN